MKRSNQKYQFRKWIFSILFSVIFVQMASAQTIDLIDPTPKVPTVSTFQNPNIINNNGISNPQIPNIYNQNLNIQQQNQLLIQQANRQYEQRKRQREIIQKELAELNKPNIRYDLPSFWKVPETYFYKKAFKQLSETNENNYSLKQTTFIVENAYYEGKENYDEFNKIIKQIGTFLLDKMVEFGYDKNSNLAKNFILFRFFSDTLKFDKKGFYHMPINYDFDDAFGQNDWSKMFVTKLLRTNKGQCSSMPRLYLILAEEINAEAFLAFSPNHTYIRFQDDGLWYNVELTNHMFTTNSMILNSGYIKAEALANKVYMSNLSKKQILAQQFVELASSYIHKFGYDKFVKQIIDKALLLDPKSINANMVLANYLTVKFEYVMEQLHINPRNKQELQNIKYYPKAIKLLNQVNQQYDKIDNLGFEYMSKEAYDNWLNSLKQTMKKEQSKEIKKGFENKLINKTKFED